MSSRKYHNTDGISSNLTRKQFFSDFLMHLKKSAKEAYDSKTNEHVKEFLIGKLPITIQNELSVAGKQEATVDEIIDFVQRRHHYQQLMGAQKTQPFNDVS